MHACVAIVVDLFFSYLGIIRELRQLLYEATVAALCEGKGQDSEGKGGMNTATTQLQKMEKLSAKTIQANFTDSESSAHPTGHVQAELHERRHSNCSYFAKCSLIHGPISSASCTPQT